GRRRSQQQPPQLSAAAARVRRAAYENGASRRLQQRQLSASPGAAAALHLMRVSRVSVSPAATPTAVRHCRPPRSVAGAPHDMTYESIDEPLLPPPPAAAAAAAAHHLRRQCQWRWQLLIIRRCPITAIDDCRQRAAHGVRVQLRHHRAVRARRLLGRVHCLRLRRRLAAGPADLLTTIESRDGNAEAAARSRRDQMTKRRRIPNLSTPEM
uniref:POP1 domain-containing protein n=1 Tax=Macrostomum lignano TaxID=282301 RepID=A0A1I8FNE0_9PLAT